VLELIKSELTRLFGPEFAQLAGTVYWTVIAPLFAQPTLAPLFIASSVLVGGAYLLRKSEPGSKSFLSRCFAFLVPRHIYGHRSAILDYKFYVATQYLLHFVKIAQFAVGVAAVLGIAEGVRRLLELILGPSDGTGQPGLIASIVFTVVMALAFDAARFLSHWVFHKSPVLWEFHKVHHSAEVLTPFTAFRAHPVDQFVEFLFRAIAVSAVSGAFGYFYPEGVEELTILGYSGITFIFHLTVHLRHSHIPVGFGRLSTILISPFMHQLHHSTAPEHFDKNFGFIFSFWDRLAGTLYVPRPDERFEVGLPDEADRFQSLWDLYVRPFGAATRALFAPRGSAGTGLG
jgi:Sterol desaturase